MASKGGLWGPYEFFQSSPFITKWIVLVTFLVAVWFSSFL